MSSPASDTDTPPPQEAQPPFRERLLEVAAVMGRLGWTAFGGPAAHVALLKEEVVERRRWVTEQQFLDLFGASGLMPGPTSTELCIHLGMTRAGVPGLWVAGACFITPAVLLTLAIAWAYVQFGALPAVQGLLLGIKPAVVVVVAAAVAGLVRPALRSAPLGVLAFLVGALYLLGVSEIGLLLAAGVLGIALARPWRRLAALLPFWWLPAVAQAEGARPSIPDVFLYFLKIGSVAFGSGYVLVAFLRQGLVHDYHWLTDAQLADAVAVGQFTPGPLFSTAAFVGYLVGGWQGAVAGALGIFLPSFLFVWATHGLVKRLRESPWSAGFLDGVNAGSLGLMAGVLLQLGGDALPDWKAWLLLALGAVAVFRFRVNGAWVILASGLAGLALWP